MVRTSGNDIALVSGSGNIISSPLVHTTTHGQSVYPDIALHISNYYINTVYEQLQEIASNNIQSVTIYDNLQYTVICIIRKSKIYDQRQHTVSQNMQSVYRQLQYPNNGNIWIARMYDQCNMPSVRRVWRWQRGNQNLYIEEQTKQWPKEKVQKSKQRSTKIIYNIPSVWI
jgi:hypothetical protein